VDEFAGLFGRHRSWAYRMLYGGHLKKLSLPGRVLIPVTEAQRLVSDLAPHGEAGR